MVDFYLEYKTSLSNEFFYDDEDTEKFDAWLIDQLYKAGLFDWSSKDTPVGIVGVTTLSMYVNAFRDDHTIEVFIEVDGGSHDLDELADNEDLCRYIERDLAYRILDELNAICADVVFPMNNGSFKYLKFDGEEFYSVLLYTEDQGYLISPGIKNEHLEIYRDFELLM